MYICKKGWCFLTNEAIEKIRLAESDAAKTVADAKKQASGIRSGALENVVEIEKKAEAECVRIAKEAGDTAKRKSDGIIDSGVNSARVEAKKLLSEAAPKIDEASEKIIRVIFEKWQ